MWALIYKTSFGEKSMYSPSPPFVRLAPPPPTLRNKNTKDLLSLFFFLRFPHNSLCHNLSFPPTFIVLLLLVFIIITRSTRETLLFSSKELSPLFPFFPLSEAARFIFYFTPFLDLLLPRADSNNCPSSSSSSSRSRPGLL